MSGIIAGLAGMLLAIPALRVRGPYLAMVTIAFGFVVEQGAAEWQGLTGGWNGLSGIPGPRVFGAEIGERGIAYLTLALVVLAIAAFAWLSRSVWGNAMRAVRDSESASVSIGLDPTLDPHRGVRHLGGRGRLGRRRLSPRSAISSARNPFRSSSRSCSCLVVMLGGADRVLGPIVGALRRRAVAGTAGDARPISPAVRRRVDARRAAARADGLGRVDRERCCPGRSATRLQKGEATSAAFSPPAQAAKRLRCAIFR